MIPSWLPLTINSAIVDRSFVFWFPSFLSSNIFISIYLSFDYLFRFFVLCLVFPMTLLRVCCFLLFLIPSAKEKIRETARKTGATFLQTTKSEGSVHLFYFAGRQEKWAKVKILLQTVFEVLANPHYVWILESYITQMGYVHFLVLCYSCLALFYLWKHSEKCIVKMSFTNPSMHYRRCKKNRWQP